MPDPGGGLAPLAVAIPIVAGCVLLAAARRLPRSAIDAIASIGAAATAVVLAAVFARTGSGRVVTWIGQWTPVHGHSVGIVFVADRLGAGAALLAAALVTAALIYTWRYFEAAEAHFHVLMLLFLAGMTGFALTGDLFDMFVFFELMGAVAYALTGFKIEDPTSVQGAFNFGVVNSFGAYLTLIGITILYAHTGELGLAQLGRSLRGEAPSALLVVAFVLVVTGWLVKSAVVPFHFWLDDAHAVAPTPVCVLFSGVMVELGLYGVFRVYWTAFDEVIPVADVRRAFLIVGVLTALLGAVMCLLQRHLKRLLAFSTIAHIGLFTAAAAAMDPAGLTGAAVYVLAHAGAKSALFLCVGVLLNRFGSVDEGRLHGRGRLTPVTGVVYAVAALALCGLPPFGTGLGKSIGEDALGSAGYGFAPWLFVAVSAVTGGAVIRAGARVFLGLGPPLPRRRQPQTADETVETEAATGLARLPWSMLAPAGVLAVGSLLVGVVPGVTHALGQGAAAMIDHRGYLAQVLHGRLPTPVAAPAAVGWTSLGVLLGLLSTALALAIAAAGVYGRQRLRFRQALRRPLTAGLDGLRALHSGHVGDYIVWLLVGVGFLVALIGLPLRS